MKLGNASRIIDQDHKMNDEIFYSFLFLCIGMAGILWAQAIPKRRRDPFLSRKSLYAVGILSVLVSLYLLLKAIIQ